MVEMLVTDEEMNDLVSKLPTVQAAVHGITEERYRIAKARHAAHRDTGASRIEKVHADVDGYIVLTDADGFGHAVGIEYGTTGGRDIKYKVRKADGTEVEIERKTKRARGVGALKAAARGW